MWGYTEILPRPGPEKLKWRREKPWFSWAKAHMYGTDSTHTCLKPRAHVPWKACHGWKSRPPNYSGFLIYCLKSNVRESSQILESGKFLLVEFGIQEKNSWGIQNLGLWNPESHWWLECRIQVPLTKNQESSTRSPEPMSWNGLGLPYSGRSTNTAICSY